MSDLWDDTRGGTPAPVRLVPIRPPLLPVTAVLLGPAHPGRTVWLPLLLQHVPAGFPSPAEDYVEGLIDLNDLVGADQPSTFLMRAQGDSMEGVGIFSGDVLVVSRDAEPRNGDVVIAAVDGEFTVKTYRVGQRGPHPLPPAAGDGGPGAPPASAPYDGHRKRVVWLEAANDAYPPIRFAEGSELRVWGVVRHVVRSFRPA